MRGHDLESVHAKSAILLCACWDSRVSLDETFISLRAFTHVLHQVFNSAAEVGAKPVNRVSLYVGAVVIGQFGERHTVQARRFRDLLDGHAPPLPEFQVGYALLELES